MHMLKQMDPNLYLEVRRKQAQLWDELIAAFEDSLERWVSPVRRPETGISIEEVLADLAYGRD